MMQNARGSEGVCVHAQCSVPASVTGKRAEYTHTHVLQTEKGMVIGLQH